MLKLDKIHEDERGAIYLLKGLKEYEEITFFITKKGFARGGCIHNIHEEHLVVYEGTVEYHVGDVIETYHSGTKGYIPRGTPHYFISLTDSLVAECGATAAEKKEKHLETRKIVEEINKKRRDIK